MVKAAVDNMNLKIKKYVGLKLKINLLNNISIIAYYNLKWHM